MTGKVGLSTVEVAKVGFRSVGTEFVSTATFVNETDKRTIKAQATHDDLGVAEALAVSTLKNRYQELYPKPLRQITKTVEVDLDA